MTLFRRIPRWLKWVGLGVCLLVAFVLWLGFEVYRLSLQREAEAADAAVVLGAAVWNGRPSPVFEERIEHAIHLYRKGTVRYLVFTGGKGTNDPFIESVVASQYAVERGVAADDTFCETESRTTWGNLVGAREIASSQKMGRVLLVSDPFHMRRSISMARDLGLDAHPSPTPTTRFTRLESQLDFWLRETYLYGLYLGQRPFVDSQHPERGPFVGPCGELAASE